MFWGGLPYFCLTVTSSKFDKSRAIDSNRLGLDWGQRKRSREYDDAAASQDILPSIELDFPLASHT